MAEGTIRVAHVDHTAEPGGAEFALARVLKASGGLWEPTLYLPPRPAGVSGAFDDLPDELPTIRHGLPQPPGASSVGLPRKLSMILRLLYQALSLRVRSGFRDSDIVHANTSRAAAICMLACLGSRRRLVVHLRDQGSPEALGSWGYRLLCIALQRADGVIANSSFTLESYEGAIPPRAVARIIQSATGFDGSTPVARTRQHVQKIGMLARLTEWKGQALAIEAFSQLNCSPGITLEIAGSAAFGEGDYERRLHALAGSLGIADRVRFLGHVSDVWKLIDTWDICLQASTRPEPLGQNVLQYLILGKPVVAADEGGPSELIDDGSTGLLFRARSVEDLSRRLGLLVDSFELRQQIALNLVSQDRFLTDVGVASQHAELYREVVARTSS